MDFSSALLAVKQGKPIQRAGWNGKGLWVGLVQSENDPNQLRYLPYLEISYPKYKLTDEHIAIGSSQYPNGAKVPWLASQTDILAEDWSIVN